GDRDLAAGRRIAGRGGPRPAVRRGGGTLRRRPPVPPRPAHPPGAHPPPERGVPPAGPVPAHAGRSGEHEGRMMSRTVQITIDAHDPRGLSVFWREALGYVHPAPPGMILAPGADAAAALAAWDDFLERANVRRSKWNSSSALEDTAGTGPRIYLQQVPEDKDEKNRAHRVV